MFGTLGLQIKYLLILQHLRDITNGVFDNFFISITWFGELIIPLSVMAIVYWGINKRIGQFMLFTFGLTLFTNVFLKMTACIKRPWILDSSVKPIERVLPAADGYSFPSGHTAGATAVWGSIAYKWWNNKILRYSMIAIVLLVGFSRNYVGVHTPQDVIVSIVAGIFIMLFTDKLLKWIDKKPERDFIFYILIIWLTILLYGYLHIKCCAQMTTYNELTDTINPVSMKQGVYPKISFMLGIFTGWLLEKRLVKYEIPDKMTKIKKTVVILAGVVILYAMSSVLNSLLSAVTYKYLAYTITSFASAIFITCLYPFVIKKLN